MDTNVTTTQDALSIQNDTGTFQVPEMQPLTSDTSLSALAQLNTAQAQQAVTQQEQVAQEGQQSLDTLMSQILGETGERAQMATEQKLPELGKEVRDLQALQMKQTAEYLQGLQNIGQKNIAEETRGVGINAINRQRGIDSLLTSSLIAAKQGQIEYAQNIIDTAIAAKYEPLKTAYQYKLSMYEANLDRLTAKEKSLAEAKSQEWNAKIMEIEEREAEEKSIQQIGLKLAEFGVDTGTINSVLSAKTTEEAISIAGSKLRDPMAKLELEKVKLDMALTRERILTAQRERELLGEPTPQETKAQSDALKEKEASIPVMKDKIEAVNVLIDHPGLNSRVGSTALGRKATTTLGKLGKVVSLVGIPSSISVAKDEVSGAGQDFAGGIHKLVGGLTLDNLIAAKSRGATFGALSDSELNILATSATTLNDWEIKDKRGQGTGVWNIDEDSFKRELRTIQELTQRAIYLTQGDTFSGDENSMINNIFESDLLLEPSNYFE